MEKTFTERLEVLRADLRASNDFNTKMLLWGSFTVDYCHDVAMTKIDRSFYAFQSEPNEKPDVLVLGLNPKGDYPYASIFNNEKDGWGLNQLGRMTPEVFIHQNPWYIGGKFEDVKWNILKNLKKTIEVNEDFHSRFDKMMYMNILYFNSVDFSEFKSFSKKNWKEVYENCIRLSTLLIFEIIKPTKIICLGINSCFRPFIGQEHEEELFKNRLYKCVLNGYNVYGMSHPSSRISNSDRQEIGRQLYADWLKS